jgi:TrpR-related protein YerC/YecD
MDFQPVVSNEETDRLYEGILKLQSLEECYRFFEDLCTIKEVCSMAQRLQVSALLRQGVTYHEIVEKTGASTATISRINRCLTYGADGYNTILNRLDPRDSEEKV